MREGASDSAPGLEFEPDDPRLGVILDELERLGADSVRVLIRPWVRARAEAGVPVEIRAFAVYGDAAASNYHRRRPLPATYESIAREAIKLTGKLAACSPLSTFSADFLLADSGEILFLEGGLGYDGGRLVDPCCFDKPPNPNEIALRPNG